MTAPHETYRTVEFMIDKFADWLKHRRELSEIRRINRTDFDLIARDLRISPDDLDRLVEAGAHSADEMPQMLMALGIDLADLQRTEPLLVRDMQRVCSLCRDKAHCHSELAEGTAVEHYGDYCPNAPTIDALGELAKKH
ncbi:MAG: hypothetical protein C5B56_12390 [Proteobacteria bacterium]|nr:MAG: hypothetical protein C5B56_12390 [Pseudomonadota bacterium]